MKDTWSEIRGKAKHLLAGFLFVSFVIGGCGAAFSLFAAGISSLQNADTRYVQPVVSVAPNPEQPSSPGNGTVYPATPGETTSSSGASSSVASSSVTPGDEPLSHMHSPIGDAMDTGGVYVGARVQEAFGNMLRGVITTLFLEQSDSPQAQEGEVQSGRQSG